MGLKEAFAYPSPRVSRLLAMAEAWKQGKRPPTTVHAKHHRPKQQPSLAERLGRAGIETVARDFLAGTTKPELAERYGVSLSTIKRLLRAEGCGCHRLARHPHV